MQGSLRALSFYISAGLCLVGFFMLFVSPIEFNGTNLNFLEVYFGQGLFNASIGGFIGFIFLLPAIAILLTLALSINLNKEIKDGLRHALELILLVNLFISIILIFAAKPLFMTANDLIDRQITKLGYGPLFGGLFSLFAFALAAFGLIIPTK